MDYLNESFDKFINEARTEEQKERRRQRRLARKQALLGTDDTPNKVAKSKPIKVKEPKGPVYPDQNELNKLKNELEDLIGYYNVRDINASVYEKSKRISFDISTKDRGPRQDHGGESGDGWMSSSEVERAAKPFKKKYIPILKNIEKNFTREGFITTPWFDYGEKGHIYLGVDLKEK